VLYSDSEHQNVILPFDVDSINWDQYLNVQEGGQSTIILWTAIYEGIWRFGSIGKFLLPIAKNLLPLLVMKALQLAHEF